jgi:hypothetical protein
VEKNDALGRIVADRVENLQALDPSAILSLPRQTTEAVPPHFKVAQYHHVSDSGDHLVVVQVIRERWFGMFATVLADGFVMSSTGTKRPLTEEETWDYT